MHNQIGRIHRFVQIISHHIFHTAKCLDITVMEVAHEHHIHIVLAHQVHKSVLLVLGQVGSRCCGVIIGGAE